MTEHTPYYRAHLFFCTHKRSDDYNRRGCGHFESEALAKSLKALIKERELSKDIRVNLSGCLHRCRHEPVLVIYPEGVWYSFTSEADLQEILETHIIGGKPVPRLLLPNRGTEAPGHHQTGRGSEPEAPVGSRGEAPHLTNGTIFAQASGRSKSAIAVLRLSGPQARHAVETLTLQPPPPPRTAKLVALRHPATGELLDRALVLWFPAPRSQTGEDVAEFHLHGGRAVIEDVAALLASLPGLRPAEPGEFTRRAFENGKLDLTEAEAIADLVNAETSAQRRQALRQHEGELGRLYEGWRRHLLNLLAHFEALIDFADEELPASLEMTARLSLDSLISELAHHLEDDRRGERLRDGLSVAIIGAPNAGKSSLLNALAQRDVAIVSAQSGTTRDIIEVHLDLAGYPVVLADTAGLCDSNDLVESEGIRRAQLRAAQADIKISVFDGALWPQLDALTVEHVDADTIPVISKADVTGAISPVVKQLPALSVSVRTGQGLSALIEQLTAMAAQRLESAGQPTLTRSRHRTALDECLHALRRAVRAPLAELACEDIRLASRALGRITGRVAVDEVLDVIFRDFCIGK